MSTENGRQIFRSPATRSTTSTHWTPSTSGMSARGLPIAIPKNYYSTMTGEQPPLFRWRPMHICCMRTGSTITSTRIPPMTLVPSSG